MAGRTESTIVAVFRNSSDAQAAVADLQAAGIARNDIYIETADATSRRSRTASKEGGVTGWFKSIFGEGNDPDRSVYEDALRQGNFLLRVDAREDEIPAVEDILNRHSPVDVHGQAATAAANTTSTIPVVKEEVQVGKRQVLRGGVRVYSRIVEQPVEENVRLREERVRVERQPANRPATEADFAAGQQQAVEMQEFAEEPVVAKQARVVEEVRVGKETSERTETIRDTVRRTEVDVEQTPERAFDESDFRSDFEKRYASSGSYDTYLPAYRYGYDMASDPRYRGRSFDEVESDLRSGYAKRYPQSTWEKMKDAVRCGWNKVTGKAQATGR
ncbi:MAG: DUF2382 domain-containing protein [Acidobacteriaceae bacterium]|nr:DUF2382 domain-containing protein [Acidobacteriaceae bacterium]